LRPASGPNEAVRRPPQALVANSAGMEGRQGIGASRPNYERRLTKPEPLGSTLDLTTGTLYTTPLDASM